MSATVAVALKKVAIYILGDEKKRGKLFVLIGSIAAGFLGLMCLPVAVLSSMGSLEIETPEVDRSMFTDSAFITHILMKIRCRTSQNTQVCSLTQTMISHCLKV